jgi:general secretion pathway protein F
VGNFRYRALTQNGEIVHGTISAATAKEVLHRIEYLRLLPIETVEEKAAGPVSRDALALFGRPTRGDVTTFTRDLALLMKAGARLEDSLELLANDADTGRLRPIVNKLRSGILAGESFAEVLGRHVSLFPDMYVALVRVGEVSGTLDHVLEVIGAERVRAEAMRRKLTDAMQYPVFVLVAACCVMLFFFIFVLPQFAAVLRDFGARSDTPIHTFLDISDFLRGNATELALSAAAATAAGLVLSRRAGFRSAVVSQVSRLPGIATVFRFYRTSLFCRNLGILLGSGLTLTATLRILISIMSVSAAAASCRKHSPPRTFSLPWPFACSGSVRRPGSCRSLPVVSLNSTRPNCSAASIAWSASSDRPRSSPSVPLSGASSFR